MTTNIIPTSISTKLLLTGWLKIPETGISLIILTLNARLATMYNLNRCGCLRDEIQAESIGPVIDDKKLCAVKNYMWWIAMLCQKIFFPPYTSSRNGRLTKNFWKTTRRGLKWWIYDLWLFRKAARPQVLKLWMKIFLPECLKMNWAIETSEDTFNKWWKFHGINVS